MENAIEIKGLNKSYGDFKLDNVSFELKKGSIMGFIGANGAGKTTTIKLILNSIKKDSGKIHVFGLDHVENEVKVKQDIGVVFDELFVSEEFKENDLRVIMKNIYKNWSDEYFYKYFDQFSLIRKK